jgi:hypothetical protein
MRARKKTFAVMKWEAHQRVLIGQAPHSASSERRHVGVHLPSKENGYLASHSEDTE